MSVLRFTPHPSTVLGQIEEHTDRFLSYALRHDDEALVQIVNRYRELQASMRQSIGRLEQQKLEIELEASNALMRASNALKEVNDAL